MSLKCIKTTVLNRDGRQFILIHMHTLVLYFHGTGTISIYKGELTQCSLQF